MEEETLTKKEHPTLHIQFSPETEEFIHRLCANAIIRAIKAGTYAYETNEVESDS